MKNIIILLFILTFASSLFAGKETADAVYLNMVKEYTLRDDGSVSYRQSHQLKLLTYYAFNRRYGETFVVFDTTFQKLTVHKNTTTMASGKEVPAPSNAFNAVLPRAARNSAAYNHLREMLITHIALERGAIIDLDYEIESTPDFVPGLMGDQILAEDSPIKELVFRIKIPANQNMNFQLYNSDVNPSTKTMEKQKIYEWVFTDVPALVHEPGQAPAADILPRLQFSSVSDLNTALKPLFEQFKSSNNAPEIKLEGSSELEQVLNLQKKVVQDIATFPIPLATVGYHFRSAEQVWQSNGGTPLEKANLMAAILAKSGINAKAVLVASGTAYDLAVPSLIPFRKAGVCVHLANGQAFMLAVDDLNKLDLRYTYGGRQALVFTADGIKTPTLPKPKAERHTAVMNMQIEIKSDDSLSGQFDIHLSGAAQPYLELQRKQDQGASLLETIIPHSKLTRLSAFSENEVQLQATFEQSDALKKQKDYLFYQLPQNPYGIAALHLSNMSNTRYTALRLPYENFTETTRYQILIPENHSPVSKELTVEKNNPVGNLKISVSVEGKSIKIKRSLKLIKQGISLSEYGDFMELWRLWNTAAYKQFVFKKN